MNTVLLDIPYNDFVENSTQLYITETMIHALSFLSPEIIKRKAVFTGEKYGREMLKKIEKKVVNFLNNKINIIR